MLKKRKGVILLLTVLIVLLFAKAKSFQVKERSHPSVLLIVLDAARKDHFSCYGYQRETTPNIDKIAEEGALFTQHFSDATYTAASVPRLMSSRYDLPPDIFFQKPARADDSDSFLPLLNELVFTGSDPETTFLPDVFHQNKYRTAMFCDNPYIPEYGAIGQKFENFFPRDRKTGAAQFEIERGLSEDLIAWVASLDRKPFFAYWHILLPHAPYFTELARSEFLPEGISDQDIAHSSEKIKNSSPNILSTLDLEILRGLYDGNLFYADWLIGNVYSKLKELGQLENTVVILTADHGECLGEHDRTQHGGPPFDAVSGIPLVIRFPARIHSANIVHSLSQGVDLMPTILDLAELHLPEGKSVDGSTIIPLLTGDRHNRKSVFIGGSVRDSRFKYIPYIPALFDLASDPTELRNIYESKPEVAKNLSDEVAYFKNTYVKPSEERWRLKGPLSNKVFFKISSFEFQRPLDISDISAMVPIRLDNFSAFQPLPVVINVIGRPWLLNKIALFSSQLIPVEAKDLPPLDISTRLPKDKYEVYLFIQSTLERKEPLGLVYSMNDEPLRHENQFQFYKKVGDNFVYSLNLGQAEVLKERFSLHLEYSPSSENEGVFAIVGVQFVPSALFGIKAQEVDHTSTQRNGKVQEDFQRLRTLGYF